MHFLLDKLSNKRSINDYAFFLFLTGIFFLPSTLLIGGLFLISAAILGSFLNKRTYLKDKWNYPFLIFGIVIILSALLQNFVFNNKFEEIWDPILSLVGLGNWLPLIWFYWSFQTYLDSKDKRRLFALSLISGTVPVLLTGFGQYFLNWNGPFETLNGLIIWYQRPIEYPGGLSGLFNNQNYAGSWLNFVWPFCLALFLEKGNLIFRKIIALSFVISIGFAAFLTYSRNAWIGLITSLPIVLGKKAIYIFLIVTTALIFILFLFNIFGQNLNFIINIIPEKILLEFADEGYKGLDSTRLDIFLSALKLVKISPIFGIGAASFSQIYLLETNNWKGHSHNLLTELAISYGIPATILFFITITLILILSFRKIFISKKIYDFSLFDRAFWAALFFFLISQIFDIQYFDGKISIVAWILISGLKNIILESDTKSLNSIKRL